MWGREVDGQVLFFHLAGINNQNFLMRDEQTGSYWQQISGKAVSGPMKGKTLPLIHSDEISFGLWKKERPFGRVLAPVAKYQADYEEKDWEKSIAKAKVVVNFPNSGLAMREQVLGIFNAHAAKAYPLTKVLSEKLVLDRLGPDAILIVVGPDNLSARAFRNPSPARDFYHSSDDPSFLMTDAQTGAKWNFQGCATEGQDKGRCLEPVRMIKDYWFDWKNYHPDTAIYAK